MVEKLKEHKVLIVAAAIALAVVAFIAWPTKARAEGIKGSPPVAIGEVLGGVGWTGFYVGAGAGYQVSDTELSVPGLSIVDGLSGSGWAADARVGFDWQASGTPIVIGVLAGYNVGEAEFSAFNGALTATLEPTWYVGGRIGLALPTKTLLYGGAAWQEAKGTVSLGGGSASSTDQGIVYLAGIEQIVAPTLSLAAEYSLAQYEFSAGSLSIDPDVHAFKVRLNWRPFSK